MTHMIERGGALRTPLKLDVKVMNVSIYIKQKHSC